MLNYKLHSLALLLRRMSKIRRSLLYNAAVANILPTPGANKERPLLSQIFNHNRQNNVILYLFEVTYSFRSIPKGLQGIIPLFYQLKKPLSRPRKRHLAAKKRNL